MGSSLRAAERRSQLLLGTGWTFGRAGQLHRETHGQRQEQHATADDQAGSARENTTGRAGAAVWAGFQARGEIGRSLDGVATGGGPPQAERRTQKGGGGQHPASPRLAGAGKENPGGG